MGFRPRVSETRVYTLHHSPENTWCGRRESHPHGLSPVGFSDRRVYCSTTSAKNGASTGTCAPLSVLPRQSVAFYGLDAWSKRKDLHLRSPSGRRVYSALHLLLFALLPRGHPLGSPTRSARGSAIFALRAPSATLRKRWGLERDSHPRPSPYEGAALTAAPPSHGGPPR